MKNVRIDIPEFIERIESLCSASPSACSQLRSALNGNGSGMGTAQMLVATNDGFNTKYLNADVAMFVSAMIASLHRADGAHKQQGHAVGIGGLYGAYSKSKDERNGFDPNPSNRRNNEHLSPTAQRLASLSRMDALSLMSELRRRLPLIASAKSTVRPDWAKIAEDLSQWKNNKNSVFTRWSKEYHQITKLTS